MLWTRPSIEMYLEIANPPATVVAEKGKAAMFEDDEAARVELARVLAEGGNREDGRREAPMPARGDRRSAAEAFRSVAIDEGVGEDVRLEAARGLAEIS